MRNLPGFRHPEARQRPVEVVVEGLHGSEKLRRFCEERLPVPQLRVLERILQIPALVLQIFRLGVLQMRSTQPMRFSPPKAAWNPGIPG